MKLKKKQQGSLLMWGMLILAVLSIIIGSIQQTFVSSSKTVIEDGIVWKAQELANNLVEITKYLALYERVVYIDKDKGPLDHGIKDSEDRKKNMITVLGRGIGLDKLDPFSLGNLCGAFGIQGGALATYELGGSTVFCPYFTRVPQLTSKEMEVIVFEDWRKQGIFNKSADLPPGIYEIKLDFLNSLKNYDNSFIKWRSVAEEGEYASLFKKIKSAYVNLRYFTESSGFASQGNDRTLSIESVIEFDSAFFQSTKSRVVETESFVIRPSIPKDFTMFFLYPTTSAGVATRDFSYSIDLTKASSISGRSFFNGNLNKKIDELPTFKEFAVFSREISPRPTIGNETLLRQKFPKGLLTHFSAERWIFSGTYDGVPVINQAGYIDKGSSGVDYSMNNFFRLVPNACTGATAEIINPGKIEINCVSSGNTNCGEQCPGDPAIKTVNYPIQEVKVSGSYGFVTAPVAKLTMTTRNSYLYGSVFGGYLSSSGQDVFIKGAASWSIGDLGITSEDKLNSYNQNYLLSKAGITAPLMNMPLVYGVSSGVK
jgi:hypothetical protein